MVSERQAVVLEGPVGARMRVNGRELLYFGGTNYLGLAGRPELARGAIEAVAAYGTSFSASRQTSGTGVLHLELERRLAEFKGAEDACIYASGYLGNQILLSALCRPEDVVICDEWAHPSIVEGVPRSVRDVRFYPHRDLEALARMIRSTRHGVIAVNGVEPGTGEIAPLAELIELLPEDRFRLIVDDCHGTGVLGEHGRGTPEHVGVSSASLYQTETMSKALGSFGGFVAGSAELCTRLRDTASYIGSTPLPPAVLGASLAAVEIAMHEPQLRERMRQNARYAAGKLQALGYEVSFDGAPILFIRGIDEDRAELIHSQLYEQGILVPFVHYPTAESEGRLRLAVSAMHTAEDIDRLSAAMKEV